MEKALNYIDGKLVAPEGGSFLNVYNPATGAVYAEAPNSNKADIDLAIHAAKEAFPSWSKTSLDTRHKILNKIAELIEEKQEALALAECIDNGKPLWLANHVDIPRAAANFKFFATAILHFASESHEMPGTAINYTLRHPLGVVGCISPWNLPLYLFTWKIAPAIAAGNTVVAKPSEVTPMTAYLLSEICIEAGLPKGVLNIVHGLGQHTAAHLSVHPDIKAVSFTGSTTIGREIASKAAPLFKKLSLEMGGKNPNLIFADCDYDRMLKTTINSSFSNQGQICLCGSRIYIERSIYDQFKTDLVAKAKALKVGDPLQEENRVGAVVSKPHYDKILSYLDLAKEEGGNILCGGTALHPEGNENGWFIAPTVIENLAPDCRTNQEEIFGPVVTITPFDTDEEALAMANGTNYGLSATVWTQNLKRTHHMANALEAGIVWINTWLLRDLRTPFGGVKQSGVGREGGFDVLRFFTETKNICIKY